MISEEKLSQAIDSGLDKLIVVIKAENPTKEQLVQARLASSVLSSGVHHEGTTNARLGMQIRVASMVLKDSKERKRYLAAASPELKLLK
ncbi:hypothetical protein ES708_32036 [subsurface metagenome]